MDIIDVLTRLTDHDTAQALMQTLSYEKINLLIPTLRQMRNKPARLRYCDGLLNRKAGHSVMGTLLVGLSREAKQ